MYLQISGLAQDGQKQTKISFLLDTDENSAKEILKKYGIVVLGVQKFDDSTENFGTIEFKINHNNKEYSGIVPFSKVKEGFNFLNGLSFDVTYINNINKPVDEEKVEKILDHLKKQAHSDEEESESSFSTKQKYEEGGREKDLEKVKKIVDDTVKDAQDLIQKVDGTISPSDIKKLNNKVENLKKIKMGNNVEKISLMLEDILRDMENMENKYIESMRDLEYSSIEDSVITDLYAFQEYEKYIKGKKLSTVSSVSSTSRSVSDYYYGFLGKVGIYIKFLYTELISKISNYINIIYNFISILELLFIFLLIELSIFSLYKYILGLEIQGYVYYILNIGIAGIILYLLKYFRRKSIGNLFLIFLLFFLLFWFIRDITVNTLAL